jgi:hypothetical protein
MEEKHGMTDSELMELIKKSVSEKVSAERQNPSSQSREPMEVRWKIVNPDRPAQA